MINGSQSILAAKKITDAERPGADGPHGPAARGREDGRGAILVGTLLEELERRDRGKPDRPP